MRGEGATDTDAASRSPIPTETLLGLKVPNLFFPLLFFSSSFLLLTSPSLVHCSSLTFESFTPKTTTIPPTANMSTSLDQLKATGTVCNPTILPLHDTELRREICNPRA